MGHLIRGILAVPAVAMVVWLACWHLWLGAAWWAAAVVALAMKASWRWWLGLLPVGVLLVPWCVYGYTLQVDALTEEVRTQGPEGLEPDDLVAIWGLNLVMAGSGAVLGFYEVALETALMAVPGGRSWTVQSHDFPRCAPHLAKIVARRQQEAKAGKTEFAPLKFGWMYGDPEASWRAALALSPVTVETERVDEGLRFGFTVAVDYPEDYRMVFLRVGGLEIGVEEGLFHALEERGWMHPYRLTYETTVGLDEPAPPVCEAWVVRVLSR